MEDNLSSKVQVFYQLSCGGSLNTLEMPRCINKYSFSQNMCPRHTSNIFHLYYCVWPMGGEGGAGVQWHYKTTRGVVQTILQVLQQLTALPELTTDTILCGTKFDTYSSTVAHARDASVMVNDFSVQTPCTGRVRVKQTTGESCFTLAIIRQPLNLLSTYKQYLMYISQFVLVTYPSAIQSVS